jgi:hypothetical protein
MIPAIDEILIWARRTKPLPYSWKEHLKMSKIAKFACEML